MSFGTWKGIGHLADAASCQSTRPRPPGCGKSRPRSGGGKPTTCSFSQHRKDSWPPGPSRESAPRREARTQAPTLTPTAAHGPHSVPARRSASPEASSSSCGGAAPSPAGGYSNKRSSSPLRSASCASALPPSAVPLLPKASGAVQSAAWAEGGPMQRTSRRWRAPSLSSLLSRWWPGGDHAPGGSIWRKGKHSASLSSFDLRANPGGPTDSPGLSPGGSVGGATVSMSSKSNIPGHTPQH
mmetsp:Transcript_114144/g.323220  ORF Transcript_114144/g.323220 Transcript_114144/m.323220 type:complete len:241 (-) Transcript_114144:42-764(-)